MDKLIEQWVKVDAIITDPPYWINFHSNRRVIKKQFENIKNDNNLDWLDDYITKCFNILKNN